VPTSRNSMLGVKALRAVVAPEGTVTQFMIRIVGYISSLASLSAGAVMYATVEKVCDEKLKTTRRICDETLKAADKTCDDIIQATLEAGMPLPRTRQDV
jgi:hypothetical protein